jgi:hypothetical protein
MATPIAVQSKVSAAAREKPATTKLRFTVQRHAGQIPAGKPGRGTAEGNFEPPHYASVILGLVAVYPSEAAEVAQLLGGLKFAGSFTVTKRGLTSTNAEPALPGPNLRDVLAIMIDGLANHADGLPGLAAGGRCPDLIEVCSTPPSAVLTWNDADGSVRRDSYASFRPVSDDELNASGLRDIYPVQRVTRIKPSLIELAAELWRKTSEQRSASPASIATKED